MSWQDTLNLTVPGYDVTCRELFVTPIPDIAGIGVRVAIYAQVFIALACYTFSSTEEFTSEVMLSSTTTFTALAITSMAFLFGTPNGQHLIGLGRLRVVLGLSAISYGPGFLNLYRSNENHRFAPLTYKAEELKTKNDPELHANGTISWVLLTPVIIIVWWGILAPAVLFGICVSRLSGSKAIKAAQFCGFEDVVMSPAESVLWCTLALVIPWSMPLFPFLMIAIWKSDPVTSWRRHMQKKNITGLIGKATFWGYTTALCGLTERYISRDPSTRVPGDEELEWTFGQILAIVMLFPIFVSICRHLGKLPSYPVPEFQPSHSRLTLYLHLLFNYHGKWRNLRRFIRLSKTSFLHQEHVLWVQEGETPSKVRERRKDICKIRFEIRKFIKMEDGKVQDTVSKIIDVEATSAISDPDIKYMDLALDILKPELPVKRVRKVKSFPGTLFL